MLRLIPLLFLAACSFGPSSEDLPPLEVTASDGTAETAPLFSWVPGQATSLSVRGPGGPIWSIASGFRTLPNGHVERIPFESPIPYGAFAGLEGDETPTTSTPAKPLEPGVTYTVEITHLGGGSGGFTGQRPTVQSGSDTFTVSERIDP